MKKALLFFVLLSVLLSFSCSSSSKTVRKETCQRDEKVICSKEKAPLLEHLTEEEIGAGISKFSSKYKQKEKLVFSQTKVSEIDQCISVYQFYNCKAYCESDSITKQDKEFIDKQIIDECKGMSTGKNEISINFNFNETTNLNNRIIIDYTFENFDVYEGLTKVIQLAFEEKATANKFSIVDQDTKQKAFDKIKAEKNWTQNDPEFLPELGKQLAANIMIQIQITKLGETKYLLTNKFVGLEKAVIISTKNLKYSPSDDPKQEKIYDEFQKLADEFFATLK